MRWTTRAVPAAVGGAAVAAAGAAGWRFAQRMLTPSRSVDVWDDHDPGDEVEVLGATDGRVRLRGPRAATPGTWGLAWGDGYLQVGPPLTSQPPDVAERPVVRSFGTGLPTTGDPAVLDPHAFPSDPAAVGVPWEEVTYHSPVGALPAWRFGDPDRDRWAILVHGRGGRRTEGLRYVEALDRAGATSLAISYRNDAGAPASRDGLTHLGDSEWQDVEGAVVHALARGAREIVLLGSSQGGAAALRFLRTSAHASSVSGVILDAPVLDWVPVLRRAADHGGVPPSVSTVLVPAARAIARFRTGIEWSALDHVAHADEFTHPMLLIHGADDERVPVEVSDAFVRARPDLVRYVRVPGARHVCAWNLDPAGVEAEVERFLGGLPQAERGGAPRTSVGKALRRLRRHVG